MVFQYKFPGLYPVDAQTAGEELERIFKTPGKLDPANIVNESRDESAPLHPIFEWDDTKAAEKYRETQAETLMRSVVTIVDTPHGPQEVRAVVNVQQTYTPIHVVLESREQTDILLETALKELKAFQKKYATLSALQGVFAAIDQLTIEEVKHGTDRKSNGDRRLLRGQGAAVRP